MQAATDLACVEVLVYTSSHIAVQLPRTGVKVTEETAQLHTSKSASSYVQKYKAKAETLVLTANSHNLKTCALRLPPVYGEGDQYIIPELFSLLKQGKSNVQIGNNQALFEWLYVRNAIHALLLASQSLLQPERSAKVAGEAFFITDGTAIPYYTFARKVWLAAGDRVADNEIRRLPKGLVKMSAGINDWALWTVTAGLKRPDVKMEDLKKLEAGFEWDTTKAHHKLGYRAIVRCDEGVRNGVKEAITRPEWKNLELRGRLAP